MTDNEVRIAMAEVDGWVLEIREQYAGVKKVCGYGKNIHLGLGSADRDFATHCASLPEYLTDLNVVHEVEKKLTEKLRGDYIEHLSEVCHCDGWEIMDTPDRFDMVHATARQRCEAILRTFGKWND